MNKDKKEWIEPQDWDIEKDGLFVRDCDYYNKKKKKHYLDKWLKEHEKTKAK